MRTLPLLAAAIGALTCATAPAKAAVNIVTNPGFELRDPSTSVIDDWTVSPNTTSWFSSPGPSLFPSGPNLAPGGGSYFASTGCSAAFGPCLLSQTLSTTAGTKYTLSFLYNPGSEATASNAETKVYWGTTPLFDILGGAKIWKRYTITGLVGTGSDTLTFDGVQEAQWNGVDNVSVTAPGPVPGAGLAGLAALTLAAFAARMRRA